jgi:hypothetical protein
MGYDVMLVCGLILGLFCIPAMLAAWAESQPLFIRGAFFLIAIAMVGWPVIQSPAEYGPKNWVDLSLNVAARIIP